MGSHRVEYDEEHEKLIAPDNFDGPIGNRSCTDFLCGILLFLCWMAMTATGLYAISTGDYRLALFPLDYDGNVCGTDLEANMTEYPYLLYVNSYTGGVCVNECPKLAGMVEDNLTDIRTLVTYAGMWQPTTGGSELPLDYVKVSPAYLNSSDAIECTDDLCFPQNSEIASWHSTGISEGFGFAYYAGDTYELFWRCYLSADAERRIKNLTKAATIVSVPDPEDLLLKLYADVWVAREWVLGLGCGAALVVSFLYIFLMRIPLLLGTVIWLSIGVTIAAFGAAAYYSFIAAGQWAVQEPQIIADTVITALRLVSGCCAIVALILVSLACCLRTQIQMSIGCVKEAAKAVNRMPGILLVPVLQTIGFMAFLGAFGYYAVHLASLGNINILEFPVDIESGAEIAVRTYTFDGTTKGLAWFMLFGLFWTTNFILSVGDMVVAMSVAKWYFTREKNTVGSGLILGSIANTLFYHIGTLAFGSLLIAVVQTIRAALERIRQTIKNADSNVANKVICCCQCCFCVLESCIKFINKNAYIQAAIFGTNFLTSARQAFFLIVRNAARVGAITYVSTAVLFVGKLFISGATTTLSYYAFTHWDVDEQLNHLAGPMAAIFILAYFVSGMFMSVFDMAISTILHCFVADEEMFDGAYAEGALVKWIDNWQRDEPDRNENDANRKGYR